MTSSHSSASQPVENEPIRCNKPTQDERIINIRYISVTAAN